MVKFLSLLFLLLAATDPALAQLGSRPAARVRAVTAASDTILNTDCGNWVSFNRSSAIAVTLPQAGSNGNFAAGCVIMFENQGAGNATVTPTTSTLGGRANFVMQQGGGLAVISNGTNWITGGFPAAISSDGLMDGDQVRTATTSVTGVVRIGKCLEGTGTGNKTLDVSAACRTEGLPFDIDGGGAAITTNTCVYTGGTPCYMTVPHACTITKWEALADASGSISVELARTTYSAFDGGATHPVTGDKISASAPMALSSAVKATDATLTGWTKTLAAGDVLAVQVNSAATVKRVRFTIYCERPV